MGLLLAAASLLAWNFDLDTSTSRQAIQIEGDTLAKTTSAIPRPHNPRRFSTNTTLNVARGLQIINAWSGQHMATWIYDGTTPVEGHPGSNTWKNHEPPVKFLHTANDTVHLQQNDTVFVSYSKLDEFVSDFLPNIRDGIILITTPFHLMQH